MKVYKAFLVLMFSLFLFVGCDFEKQQYLDVHDKKPLTYAIYMAADNNLEDYAIENIDALKKVGSSDNVNIVVLFDRASGRNTTNGNWSDTRLLYITKGHTINYDIVRNYPFDEQDMTDSDTLYDFLKLVNDYYPSDKLILNIWSHGYGVSSDAQIPTNNAKSIIVDETTGSNRSMSIVNLRKALQKFNRYANKRIDILQFDACNMQMLEIAYELRTYVRYIVGAETDVPQEGSDYEALSKYFDEYANEDARTIASYMVDSFDALYKNTDRTYSYGALDTARLTSFMGFFKNLVDDVLDNANVTVIGGRTLIAQAVNDRQYLKRTVETIPEFCDFYEFALWCIDKLGGNASSGLVSKEILDANFDSLIINYCASKDMQSTRSLGVNIPYTLAQWREYRIHTNSNTEYLKIYSETQFVDLLWKMYDIFS